jgi:predicted O-methyltransferase YrrM
MAQPHEEEPGGSPPGPRRGRVARGVRRLADSASDFWIRRRLASLEPPFGARIARALARVASRRAEPDPLPGRIEALRAELLARTQPLVDGSLGAGGLYDEGQSVRAACAVSKGPPAAFLLYALVRELGPAQVLELGTNLGISSAYLAAALRANGRGALATLDASPYRQRIAAECHRRLGLPAVTYVQGLFGETLGRTLRALPPVDLAFIDGHHQYEPTLAYTEAILAAAADDAVLVYDDIRWSEGMERAWSELRADRRFRLVVDLDRLGLCVASRGATGGPRALPPIRRLFG